jgi:hypothetical protein
MNLKEKITAAMLEASVALLASQNKVRWEWYRLMASIDPMPLDDRFYVLLDSLRSLIKDQYLAKDDRMRLAAEDMFRMALHQGEDGDGSPDMGEMLSWVKAYKVLKSKISKALSPLFDYHGDGYGDLIDSFPLGGRLLVERALKTEVRHGRAVAREGFLSETEVYAFIKEESGEPWSKIVGDENYVEMMLEDAGKDWLLHWMKHHVMTAEHGKLIEGE